MRTFHSRRWSQPARLAPIQALWRRRDWQRRISIG
jgi:hypothetical protein